MARDRDRDDRVLVEERTYRMASLTISVYQIFLMIAPILSSPGAYGETRGVLLIIGLILSALWRSNGTDYVLLLLIYYRHPCVATEPIMFCFCLLSAGPIMFYFCLFIYYRQPCVATQLIMFNLCLFLFIYLFFIQRLFSETTEPILIKFSGIVYSGVVWIIR